VDVADARGWCDRVGRFDVVRALVLNHGIPRFNGC
jgi:hypothetical protein